MKLFADTAPVVAFLRGAEKFTSGNCAVLNPTGPEAKQWSLEWPLQDSQKSVGHSFQRLSSSWQPVTEASHTFSDLFSDQEKVLLLVGRCVFCRSGGLRVLCQLSSIVFELRKVAT